MILDIGSASCEAFIASGSRVVVAKPSGYGPPNVAWLAWDPLTHNIVSWTETYGLYAANVPTSDGAPIHVLDSVYPAGDSRTYPYTGSGFGEPLDGGRIPIGHYEIVNRTTSAAAFGLLQAARVNRSAVCSPVNSAVVPAGRPADFIAGPTVYAWIQPAAVAGAIASRTIPGAAVVEFAPHIPTRHCRYDRATSRIIVED